MRFRRHPPRLFEQQRRSWCGRPQRGWSRWPKRGCRVGEASKRLERFGDAWWGSTLAKFYVSPPRFFSGPCTWGGRALRLCSRGPRRAAVESAQRRACGQGPPSHATPGFLRSLCSPLCRRWGRGTGQRPELCCGNLADTQTGLLLLRHCAAFRRMVYALRVTPPQLLGEAAASFDAEVRSCLERPCTGPLHAEACGTSAGSLGLRHAARHAAAAYASSLSRAQELCVSMDPHHRRDWPSACWKTPQQASTRQCSLATGSRLQRKETFGSNSCLLRWTGLWLPSSCSRAPGARPFVLTCAYSNNRRQALGCMPCPMRCSGSTWQRPCSRSWCGSASPAGCRRGPVRGPRPQPRLLRGPHQAPQSLAQFAGCPHKRQQASAQLSTNLA